MAISNGSAAIKIEYVGERNKGLYWATTGDFEATLCLISQDDPFNGRLARIRYDVSRDQYGLVVGSRPPVMHFNTMKEAKDHAIALAVVVARLDRANNLLT